MRSVKQSDNINIAIDRGQQPDMLSGQVQEITVKRDCKLIKPTLFDYQRDQEYLKEVNK